MLVFTLELAHITFQLAQLRGKPLTIHPLNDDFGLLCASYYEHFACLSPLFVSIIIGK